MYLNECPAGPAIPIYVLVSGVVALLVIGQFVAQKTISPDLLDSKIWALWIFILDLFTLIWFIYGESLLEWRMMLVHSIKIESQACAHSVSMIRTFDHKASQCSSILWSVCVAFIRRKLIILSSCHLQAVTKFTSYISPATLRSPSTQKTWTTVLTIQLPTIPAFISRTKTRPFHASIRSGWLTATRLF